MATFVLVHGAWHGGWCWKRVTPLLRAAGHEVYTPTLTGVGERAHLLTRDIDLDTHITDIVNVVGYEDLHDVILVGHSYGGVVIAGVAQRIPDRLHHLVFLDAAFPIGDDRSMAEIYTRYRGAKAWATVEARIRDSGEGWFMPVPREENLFGVTNAEDWHWLRERLTPHPAKTWLQRNTGDDASIRRLSRTYIICPEVAGERTWYANFGERIEREGGQYYEVAGGHDAMVTMPEELSATLMSVATTTAQIPGVS